MDNYSIFETIRALNLADLAVDLILALATIGIAIAYWLQRRSIARQISVIHMTVQFIKSQNAAALSLATRKQAAEQQKGAGSKNVDPKRNPTN